MSVEKITFVHSLANKLLREHGLTQNGWRFELSNTKRAIGDCLYEDKLIRFSVHYLALTSDEEIEDTIRHEIAHALAGHDAGHDGVWRHYARVVGARPQACSNRAKSTAKYNYMFTCPQCGWKHYRYRLKRSVMRHVCAHCGGQLEFYKLKRS
jgi:predicted SprT family Zn-dependent metalloprotease